MRKSFLYMAAGLLLALQAKDVFAVPQNSGPPYALAPGSAAGNLGYNPGVWTTLSTSQTISLPGRYKVTTAGITIAVSNAIFGDITIKDATGSSNPAIALSGSFDGASGSSISFPLQSVTMSWDAGSSTYRSF